MLRHLYLFVVICVVSVSVFYLGFDRGDHGHDFYFDDVVSGSVIGAKMKFIDGLSFSKISLFLEGFIMEDIEIKVSSDS